MRARIPHCTAALAVLLLVPACAQDATVVEPAAPRHASSITAATAALAELAATVAAPIESPFLIVFDDINPCTGETVTFRFEGTSRTQRVGEHRIVHIAGTVTTSDGWTGMFNRQLVFHGTEVSTRRFFDMEVGPDGQRQLFTSVLHITIVDGEIVTQIANPKLRCVGRPPG